MLEGTDGFMGGTEGTGRDKGVVVEDKERTEGVVVGKEREKWKA